MLIGVMAVTFSYHPRELRCINPFFVFWLTYFFQYISMHITERMVVVTKVGCCGAM